MTPDRAGLAALADRVELEEPTPRLWLDAWFAAWPNAPTERTGVFHQFVVMRAYRDAAAMLMPNGWRIYVNNHAPETYGVGLISTLHPLLGVDGRASGPHAEARARLAAALRAHAAGGDRE